MTNLSSETQQALRSNNIISEQEVAIMAGDLYVAENVLTKGGGEPDYEMEMLPPNVFNYAKVGDASKRMSQNPKLKFYKRVGQHDFYERIP